jgi:amino acid adenylation domain-containing protein
MTPEIHTSSGTAPQTVASAALPEPLRTWSGTNTDYPREKTVAAIFEEIAAAHADAVAVNFADSRLTYAELNARANLLAHRLRQLGVGPESIVGCCMKRSIELIVSLVAVLKAGGAYVPLDPAYPKERFDLLVRNTGTRLILTQSSLESSLPILRDVQVLCVDDTVRDAASDSAAGNPLCVGGPTNLAYVMHTSGSTGNPKGVLVENRAIVRLVRNTNYCAFGPQEVFLFFAPISFDASTFEIWGALLNGGRLVVMPPDASSLDALAQAIREYEVTTLWLTAGLFHLMVEQQLDGLRPLRQLLAGGDVLSPSHVQTFLESVPDTALINGYGPTENTTFTCCYTLPRRKQAPDSVPIGRPISNTQTYVLDAEMNPLPVGEAGELYAAGDGVARGYLNDPEATSAKFVRDPFASDSNRRMYRTGDLARWRDDGVLEFLGRIDDQVKILGYRIEPGEIETILRACEGVKQICVVSRTESNGSKRLIAYYVASLSGLAPERLREVATQKLPQHMIPALFIPLDSFPLSANGKTDRAALAQREIQVKTTQLELPQSGIEQTVTELWKQILNAPQVGLDDNFFDLGGDSLLLVAVHSNLQKMLHAEIPVTDLFEYTTVRKLAAHLGKQQPSSTDLAEAQQRAKRQREAFVRLQARRSSGGES